MQYAGAVHTVVLGATLTLMPFAHAGQPLLDFSSSDVVQTFRVINDDVMGGVSTSRLRSTDGAMVFEGEVSLENGGGFASFRGPVRFPERSMVLLVTVRGDGQRYKLTLKVERQHEHAPVPGRVRRATRLADAAFRSGKFRSKLPRARYCGSDRAVR
ncbi:MAG: CIA30 family protein [Propionivibrio sp.]|nr:CIA30 family protein [Propionivibrio sp.]